MLSGELGVVFRFGGQVDRCFICDEVSDGENLRMAVTVCTNLSAKEWSCTYEPCVRLFFSRGMARCERPNVVDVEEEEKLEGRRAQVCCCVLAWTPVTLACSRVKGEIRQEQSRSSEKVNGSLSNN